MLVELLLFFAFFLLVLFLRFSSDCRLSLFTYAFVAFFPFSQNSDCWIGFFIVVIKEFFFRFVCCIHFGTKKMFFLFLSSFSEYFVSFVVVVVLVQCTSVQLFCRYSYIFFFVKLKQIYFCVHVPVNLIPFLKMFL